jgi:nucleoside-diphosphate-sugar epimerase
MKRVVVTGASGFIGCQTLKLLNKSGYEVCAITSDIKNKLTIEGVHWEEINLLNKEDIKPILEKFNPTDFLHFAWDATPGKYTNSEENLKWVRASIDMLILFKNNGGKRFVFAGTCFEYDLKYGYLIENTTPTNPSSLYGTCKLSFENIAQKYCLNNDIKFITGRIFYLYGERENSRRVIPYVINCLLNNETAYCSHGNQVRDFLNVKDVASAFVEILKSDVEGVVNIGSGNAIKLREILLKIGEKLEKKQLINFGDENTPMNEPEMIVANINKLKNETNWVQKYDLNSGLDETINWWMENGK